VKGSAKLSAGDTPVRSDLLKIVDEPSHRAEATPASIAKAIAQIQYPRDEIIARQQRIHAEVLQLSRSMDKPNFSRIDSDDLRRMTMLYDRDFFDSQLLTLIGRERLRFGFSSRMTRVAGKLVTHYTNRRKRIIPLRKPSPSDDRKFEMILSSTLLFQAFNDVDRPIVVTGLRCRDRLEAMQRVCEHELVHLLEMFIWNDSSCSASRFQSIAQRYFGHTEHRHDLITQSERAARNFDIRVGSVVRFAHDGAHLTGWVNRITRRATILVEDVRGERFNDGKRYARFYVPLEKLELVQPRGSVGNRTSGSPTILPPRW
jgi:hypothetical protein